MNPPRPARPRLFVVAEGVMVLATSLVLLQDTGGVASPPRPNRRLRASYMLGALRSILFTITD